MAQKLALALTSMQDEVKLLALRGAQEPPPADRKAAEAAVRADAADARARNAGRAARAPVEMTAAEVGATAEAEVRAIAAEARTTAGVEVGASEAVTTARGDWTGQEPEGSLHTTPATRPRRPAPPPPDLATRAPSQLKAVVDLTPRWGAPADCGPAARSLAAETHGGVFGSVVVSLPRSTVAAYASFVHVASKNAKMMSRVLDDASRSSGNARAHDSTASSKQPTDELAAEQRWLAAAQIGGRGAVIQHFSTRLLGGHYDGHDRL